MVMSFFRKGESGIEHIERRVVSMLGEARHSYDMAIAAVIGGADPDTVEADIFETDERINRAEQELRGELVVHISVQGADNIGAVLAYTLLIKKIERIGDQAKNVFDLTREGVSLAGSPDSAELQRYASKISGLFGEVTEILSDGDAEHAMEFRATCDKLRHECEQHVRNFMHTDEPGHYAVPRAVLYRYWKRIVANLSGVVIGVTEPLQHHEYLDGDSTGLADC